MRRLRAAAAVVAGAAVAYAGLTAVAQAAVIATASGAQTASSASWKIVPSPTTTPLGPGTATVTGSLLSGPQYLYIVNTGTATLATGFTATYGISAAGLGLGYMDLNACTGTWNEVTNACTGGTTQLLASTSASRVGIATPPLPVAPNGRLRVQVSFTGVNVVSTGTVSASVTRSTGAGTTSTS